MTCKSIYDAALRLLAESVNPEDNADYEERAPYLIAAFCTEHKDTDARLREFLGKTAIPDFESLYIELDSTFPLLPKLAACASLYVAAMLVIDDFPELSDRLYDRYCDCASRIYESVLGKSEKTSNKYFSS